MFEIDVKLPSGQTVPCRVTHAPRSKYVRVRLSLRGELHLLVPAHRRIDQDEAQRILHDMTPWIDKALKRMHRRQVAVPPQVLAVPGCIELPAMGELWQVRCIDMPPVTPRRQIMLKAEESYITLRGSVQNIPLCCTVLQKWLLAHATDCLRQLTHTMAARHGFKVNKVSVRAQRSRWGSCSRLGNISLNYRVILLPQKLVEYLILHELCHLRHMNHSAVFKACLHSFEKDWQVYEKALNEAWRMLPPWLMHGTENTGK